MQLLSSMRSEGLRVFWTRGSECSRSHCVPTEFVGKSSSQVCYEKASGGGVEE